MMNISVGKTVNEYVGGRRPGRLEGSEQGGKREEVKSQR